MASAEVSYARLLRPFPTKRLADVLYHVEADAASITQALQRLLIDPPATPEEWRYELDRIGLLLWSLRERCEEAAPKIETLSRDADHSFQAALNAMRVLMSGLRMSDSSPPLAAIEPEHVREAGLVTLGRRSPENAPASGDA